MLVSNDVEHLVAHTHTHNGLVESLIKHLQLIARPLLWRTNLCLSAWRHAILHVVTLIWICPTTNYEFSHLHLRLLTKYFIYTYFRLCCLCFLTLPQCSKLGLQRWLSIYVSFNSLCTINYLKPLIGGVFTTRFVDCHFDKNVFTMPLIEGGGGKSILE